MPVSSTLKTLVKLTASLSCETELFRNQALASYHSTKSGHTEFEESTEELKPLTEEEKAQKLEEVSVEPAAGTSARPDPGR